MEVLGSTFIEVRDEVFKSREMRASYPIQRTVRSFVLSIDADRHRNTRRLKAHRGGGTL